MYTNKDKSSSERKSSDSRSKSIFGIPVMYLRLELTCVMYSSMTYLHLRHIYCLTSGLGDLFLCKRSEHLCLYQTLNP